MKTILIATDFSKAAHNAALYSMELAKAFNARLMLFNSYQPVPVSVDVAPVFVPLVRLIVLRLCKAK
jgi:nucleotide-binding universal stress UspA family protein